MIAAACSSQQALRHPAFVDDNVAKLDVGMTPSEVQAILGDPDEIQERTCGTAVGEPWPCTAWIFRMAGGYTNLLVFDAATDPPQLDGWHLGQVLPQPEAVTDSRSDVYPHEHLPMLSTAPATPDSQPCKKHRG